MKEMWKYWWGNFNERDHTEDLNVDGSNVYINPLKNILTWTLSSYRTVNTLRLGYKNQ